MPIDIFSIEIPLLFIGILMLSVGFYRRLNNIPSDDGWDENQDDIPTEEIVIPF